MFSLLTFYISSLTKGVSYKLNQPVGVGRPQD